MMNFRKIARVFWPKTCYSKYLRGLASDARCSFKPRTAAVLTKMTRYEFEKKRCKDMTEDDLRNYLESKRSDYWGLLERHKHYHLCVEIIRKNLMSEGRLCLPKEYSAVNFAAAIKRLLDGNFKWKWRQRIRVTMSGLHENDEAIELHDQQLEFLEHRYTEHVNENETVRHYANISDNAASERVLPVLALNEVFIGESLSSRVSYYEIQFDNNPGEKQKSSGVTVCTGTGSTSWFFHINHLPHIAVKELLQITVFKVQVPRGFANK
ncbi:hypothetical protein KUTeg_016281 [Tegillarca granosa]|uniref:Uncharacterized protein n=1 Tax=Tegillarca granosa TaxID=220873 RepID=A0ABQ9EKF1_TEGGR|nr:hypothetical protein KUTeg_016281 [Tegillarca granosa]